jgi:hypothetical protein
MAIGEEAFTEVRADETGSAGDSKMQRVGLLDESLLQCIGCVALPD